MTDSSLTTDIIVIVVLVVVLSLYFSIEDKKKSVSCISKLDFDFISVLIGICAFVAHFYWTKIGVSEIWNTAKWSSMRSSFYRTIGRLSRSNSAKSNPSRPWSAASAFSPEPELENPANNQENRESRSVINNNKSGNQQTVMPSSQSNLRNQTQPVKSTTYNHPIKPDGDQRTRSNDRSAATRTIENDEQYPQSTDQYKSQRF